MHELKQYNMSEIKERVYSTGYFTGNGYKESIRFEDGKYRNFIYSEFNYKRTISTKCYDINGNYLGWYDKFDFFSKKEEKEVDKQLSVVQINYKFYLLPLGRVVTMDEVYSCESLLKDSFNIKETGWRGSELANVEHCISNFHETGYYKPEEVFVPLEICKIGHSRHIENRTNKKLFDLDVKKYTKEKNDFIKENPDFEDSVEPIYQANIGFLMSFWNLSKKQILYNRFDKTKASIEKLNRKINNKIKNN